MKHLLFLLTTLALIAAFGCDQSQSPTYPGNTGALKKGVASSAATITVPDDYATIQEAIDAAKPNDKIQVKASGSPYNEIVSVRTSRIHINADGKVLLNGGFIVAFADSVKITNFMIDASMPPPGIAGTGIAVGAASAIEISENKIRSAWRGIELTNSTECVVTNNTLTGAQANAIFLFAADGNTISKNSCTQNFQGINMPDSDNNVVFDNDFSDNRDVGMEVSNGSTGNRFESNHCDHNGRHGINIYSSDNNLFGPGNTANLNAQFGILVSSANGGNTVKGNQSHCNGSGDILDLGIGNNILENSTGPPPEGCSN